MLILKNTLRYIRISVIN